MLARCSVTLSVFGRFVHTCRLPHYDYHQAYAMGDSVVDVDCIHDVGVHSVDDNTLDSNPNGMGYSTYSNSNRTTSSVDNPT